MSSAEVPTLYWEEPTRRPTLVLWCVTGLGTLAIAGTAMLVIQTVSAAVIWIGFATFADGIMDDAECLYVVGLMARLSPWLLGADLETWEARSTEFRSRYRMLRPDGLPPAHFAGRGAYGAYFAGQVDVPGGF